MTAEADIRALLAQKYVAVWPPDDTEESILGTNLHQTTITNLRFGLNEAAHHSRPAGGSLPWQASGQILILGWRRFDGTAYRIYPDVFVYPHPIDRNRSSLSISLDGPPVLVIEVVSEWTYDADLNIETGKGYSYMQGGVREYLALDPTGAFVADGGRGWRFVEGGYQPWERDANGRWHSREIAVAFGIEGVMGTVYTREGRRMLHEGEVEEQLGRRTADLEEQVAREAAEIEDLRRRLRDSGREQEKGGLYLAPIAATRLRKRSTSSRPDSTPISRS